LLLILEFQSFQILKYKEQHYSSLHQWFTFQQATQVYPAKLSLSTSLLAVNYTEELRISSDGSRQPTPMLIVQQSSQPRAFYLKLSLAWLLLNNFLICGRRIQPSGCSTHKFHLAVAELQQKGSHLVHPGNKKQNWVHQWLLTTVVNAFEPGQPDPIMALG